MAINLGDHMNEVMLSFALLSNYVSYGGYHWLPFYQSLPSGVTKLQWGIESNRQLGMKAIRVPLGYSSSDPFGNQPPSGTPNYLATMLQHPDYLALLDDPGIEIIVFTSYTEQAFKQSASQAGQMDGWMNLDLPLERNEYLNAALFAGQRAPKKKIVFANWEADHEGATTTNIAQFITLLQARVDGIARANMPNVLSGIEVALLGGLVFPYLKTLAPDRILYSTWEVISPLKDSTSVTALASSMRSKLNVIKDLTGYNPDQIIVGEFGYEHGAVMPVFDFMKTLDTVFKEFGVEYAFFWQLHWDSYNHGAFDINGNILPIGRYLRHFAQRRIVTQVVEGRYCIPPDFGMPEASFFPGGRPKQ
jgi:hypothetical protein